MARSKFESLCPSNTTETHLYSVPESTEVDAVLRICNKDTLSSKFSVAHCDAGHGSNTAATVTDWIYYDKSIMPNTTIELSIHAGPLETIRIKSGTASMVVFHLSGNKKVAS